MKTYWKNYIDGSWVDGGAGRVDVINPGTGEKLAEHALANAGDVDRAVMAAQRVHLSGALCDLRPVERGRMVQAMGRYLLDHIEDIAPVLTLEQASRFGNPVSRLRGPRATLSITAIKLKRLRGGQFLLEKAILISQPMSRSAYRRRSSLGIIPLK